MMHIAHLLVRLLLLVVVVSSCKKKKEECKLKCSPFHKCRKCSKNPCNEQVQIHPDIYERTPNKAVFENESDLRHKH